MQNVLHGLQGLSGITGFAIHFVPIYWNRTSHVQTNVILLWGVREGLLVLLIFVCLFVFLFLLPHDAGLLYMKPEARVFVTAVVRAVKNK